MRIQKLLARLRHSFVSREDCRLDVLLCTVAGEIYWCFVSAIYCRLDYGGRYDASRRLSASTSAVRQSTDASTSTKTTHTRVSGRILLRQRQTFYDKTLSSTDTVGQYNFLKKYKLDY